MASIAELDKNFASNSVTAEDDVVWYDVRKAPFKLYGLCANEKGEFIRIPRQVALDCNNEGLRWLYRSIPGGRVRFKTDSPIVAVKVFADGLSKMPHNSLLGSSGMDFYLQRDGNFSFFGEFHPENDSNCEYDGKLYMPEGANDCVLSLPLYAELEEVYIGLKRGYGVEAGEPYAIEKPIVFYGSSITQGGCAPRPSCSYEAIISHRLNADFVNLGFSGSALGESAMAEYIAGLEMSAFVMDYDFNAPSYEHLKATHLPFFEIIRKRNPELPIIMVSKPSYPVSECTALIRENCEHAVQSGDRNVRFIDGSLMFDGIRDYCTVDGCHPNALGFYRMAKVIGDVLCEMLRN